MYICVHSLFYFSALSQPLWTNWLTLAAKIMRTHTLTSLSSRVPTFKRAEIPNRRQQGRNFLFQSSHKHPSGSDVLARGSSTSKKFKSAVRHFYKARKHKNELGSKTENNIQKNRKLQAATGHWVKMAASEKYNIHDKLMTKTVITDRIKHLMDRLQERHKNADLILWL